MKIGFNDLNISLKVLVVFGWISCTLFVAGFIVGFIQALWVV
jgi:hypothetical protein